MALSPTLGGRTTANADVAAAMAAAGLGRTTMAGGPVGSAYSPAAATPRSTLTPVTRPATGYGPGGTLGGFGVPAQKPSPAALAGARATTGQPVQVPTSSLPSLAPAAGGGLVGAIAGGYGSGAGVGPDGKPLGMAGGAPSPMGLPGRMGPIDMTIAGPALSVAGALTGTPLGLVGMLANGYNAVASDQIAGALGGGLDFGQWLGAILGLNRYGQGTYTGAPNGILPGSAPFQPTPGFTPSPMRPSAYSQMTREQQGSHDAGIRAQHEDNMRNGGSMTGPGLGATY